MTAQLTCNACKTRVSLSSMRYSKDGKGLICDGCWTKQNGGANLRIPKPVFTRPVDATPREKVDFTCRSCSFRWHRGLDFRGPKLCPNCGKDSIMYNLPNDADDLLRALDKMDDV